MITYIVGLLAIVLVGLNWPFPQSGPKPIHRMPCPQLSESMIAWENDTVLYECPEHSYTAHIFSKAPLVVYIENFLSPEERAHLLRISDPIYAPSQVTHDGGATSEENKRVRDSEVALLPRDDVVRCIEARARALQGWKNELWLERLRAQRYRAGGHYGYHFDWTPQRGGWGRVSSMMVYVDDDEGRLEGGGTEFPRLKRRGDEKWCRFVECPDKSEKEEGMGVEFKAVPGNAIFWENFSSDGFARGYEETFHAGSPVKKGVKVGLNIWSWGRID